MSKIIFGSVVLHAERAVPSFEIPSLSGIPRRLGQHTLGRYNGSWIEANNLPATEIYLPQRYKQLSLTTTSETTRIPLISELETLDSLYPNARQLYKLNKLLESLNTLDDDWAAVVNIAGAVQDGAPVSGSFYLLSAGVPIYLSLVFDIEENSVQLAWGNFDFRQEVQALGLFRYVFFPMPTLISRPIFVHTQNLCSRWWRTIKGFGEGRHGLLRASNALEIMLYKDPNVESYGGQRD